MIFKKRRRKKTVTQKDGSEKKLSPVIIREIISFMLLAAAATVAGVLVSIAFGKSMVMSGEAMTPTIADGQKVYIDRLSYYASSPETDDIIVFYSSGNKARTYIRRVVAVPGDSVLISNGRLYVNGELKDDGFDAMEEAGSASEEITLSDGEYFVLGDNRNASEDSRSVNIGMVKEETILGKIRT